MDWTTGMQWLVSKYEKQQEEWVLVHTRSDIQASNHSEALTRYLVKEGLDPKLWKLEGTDQASDGEFQIYAQRI